MIDNNTTYRAFFALLRSGLWNLPLSDERLFNVSTPWNPILTLARKQTVLPIVADAVFRLPESQQPKRDVLMKLVQTVTVTSRHHSVLNSTIANVVTQLESKDIRPVLLKGQGVASVYPNPKLRTCGDIDLYVGLENYTAACHTMLKLTNIAEEYTESEKHFHIDFNGVAVEIHRFAERLFNPIQDNRFQKWSVEYLHSHKTSIVELCGVNVHIPSSEFNVVYIFNHLWHHFLTGGIGLRQLCDWAMVLHTRSVTVNDDDLRRHLKNFGLWQVWRIFGCVIVNKLGLPKEEFPFYDESLESKSQVILDRILNEGNFGKYSNALVNRPDSMIMGKLHSLRRISKRTACIFMISPVRVMEYYVCFLITGVMAVVKDLCNIRMSYMKKI